MHAAKQEVVVRVMYRLGVFDVLDTQRPVEYFGRDYNCGEFDTRVMRRAIAGYNRAAAKCDHCTLSMAAFIAS